MQGAIIHAPGDVRCEERPDPTIQKPTDAVIRTVAACVCGSDLWRYRGVAEVPQPVPIGHEYVGVVEKVGDDVTTVKVGDFVVGGFGTSCGTCPTCRKGATLNCPNREAYDGCQASMIRVPWADGTLVATPEQPPADLVPSLLALSDVMCTGWHAAVCAGVGPGSSVVVVGDGAVGLCAVLAAKVKGAERIIAMSRHADRQALAREFGATDVIAERGTGGVEQVKELTEGIGADCALECVGTSESIGQAFESVRVGGRVGAVGLPHDPEVDYTSLFWRNVGFQGGPAHVRAYLPELLPMVWDRRIEPGRVFDLRLPLAEVGEAYKAMDERRAIKVLLEP